MAIKIIVDSSSDISQDEANNLGIKIMPHQITFKEEEFLDGITITPFDFYDKLEKAVELPKTSQINEFQFKEEYDKIIENGDEAIVITISSKLSGTYNNAVLASKGLENKIYVIDSLSASAGERLLCQRALELIENGKNAKEIAEILNKEKNKMVVMAMINTLKYLKKGGRISSTVAFAGELLSIKPVVAVVDGEIKMIGKAMGVKKGYVLLNSIIEQKGGIDYSKPHTFIWSGKDKAFLDNYITMNSEFKDNLDFPQKMIGSTIGTHVGPGAIGIAFFIK